MMLGDYPQIAQLKLDIAPHKKLWDLVVEFDNKMNTLWKKGELKKLVPDEVEADYRRMFSASNQLAYLFE